MLARSSVKVEELTALLETIDPVRGDNEMFDKVVLPLSRTFEQRIRN